MIKHYDCIVAGSCVVDLLCRPVSLEKPIGQGVLHAVDPLIVTTGGITCNSGITMARMGLNVGVFTYVGNDVWASVVENLLQADRVDTSLLRRHETDATSTTVVTIDPDGERSFFHCVGAPREMDAKMFLDHLEVFRRTRMLLVGYYSLMPKLEPDLPRVFEAVRAVGCRTALDAAGAGGTMRPLDRILPHLDVYVPSHAEAKHQTGEDDPRKIIDIFRGCGAPGILGVKLGRQGVLLSAKAGDYVRISICQPPGPVVDTTGAGDSFYAGLLTGLLKGLPLEQAGRLGAAAGACCVTALGGSTGGRDYQFTAQLALR